MAEYEWDFASLTSHSFTQELIRGTYHNTLRNDQLYIWIKKEDMEYLNNNFSSWLNIEDIQEKEYKRIVVHIYLDKQYPMSIIYVSGSPDTSEYNMSDLGNVAVCEASTVEKYNADLADDELFDLNFGTNSAKSLTDAYKLGIKYQKFMTDLQDLGYTMISTPLSGLITEY